MTGQIFLGHEAISFISISRNVCILASTGDCDFEKLQKLIYAVVFLSVSEIFKKHFQDTASTPAAEAMEIWQLLYMTWKRYACLPLLYSCLETMLTFFNQINTAENSNISFWCLQNCTIVSELKIQFLARATLLQ